MDAGNDELPVSTEHEVADLCGGTEAVCKALLDVLKDLEGAAELLSEDGDKSAASILEGIQKRDILRVMFLNDVSLTSVVNPEWNTQSRQHWLEVMRSRGAGSMVADTGERANAEAALDVFVALELLSAVCAQPAPTPDSEKERINEFRERFRRAVQT